MGKASIQSALKLGRDKHIIKGCNDLKEAILAKSTVDGGWLYRHFNDKSAPKNEAFIYLRAVLSQQCLENSDLTCALTTAVLDSDTFPIDNHFLMSILTTDATSEKNQKVEEHSRYDGTSVISQQQPFQIWTLEALSRSPQLDYESAPGSQTWTLWGAKATLWLRKVTESSGGDVVATEAVAKVRFPRFVG
jgi:hypothetical protein